MGMVKLFPHQQEAMDETEGLQNIAVYHDMGLGKTFTGSEMMKRFGCRINLIVCQKSKVQDWEEHFGNYSDNEFQDAYDLTKKKELEEFLEYSKPEYEGNNPIVGVINYDLIFRRKQLQKLQDFCLMLDESSIIQNKKAQRTKFILKMKPKHCILLSGTPVGGKYENLWTQLHLLGWDISEALYEKQYVNWKLIDAGGMKHKIVDKEDPYKNTDRLKRKMREHGAVFKKTDECFELPEQIFTRVMVDPIKEYWKFQKNCIVNIDGLDFVGDTSLTKLLFSRQLCGSYNQNKLDAFRDLVESTQDRLIVFYNFNDELWNMKKILQDLERPTSEINGHEKDLTAFRNESNAVCLCQYQSASKGLNLQEYGCNKMIYFTLPLSSEDFEQSKKRIHRIGQTDTCFYYLMMCRGTVEEQILHTLEERKDFTDELFKMVEADKKNQKKDS